VSHPVNVATLLTRAAALHGGRVALRHGDRRITYSELRELTARFGSALVGRGLVRGDRVALFMKNAPEHTIALFGAMAAGLVIVPINAKLAGAELEVILEDSGARALVHASGEAVARARLDDVDVLVACGPELDELLTEGDPGHRPVDVPDDDVAWLFYTSGTTGRPKGAELTHRNLTVMTWTLLADVCSFAPDDVVLHVAPLSHGSGLYLLGAIARGADNLIYDSASFDPDDVLGLVERERVTVIAFLAPTMIVMLLGAREGHDLASLRCAVYGGAPIHVDHARRMLARFGRVFVQIYGQGESPMTIAYHAADAHDPDDPESLAAAGLPHPGVEVRLVDEAGEPVRDGAAGEVCVRGDVVMRGYWRNPQATARSLRCGWLHTGDIGRFDDRGRLVLLDRSDDTIISGGTNIYPREVEEVLVTHPGVGEVVVFGIPDELWGESVVAAVVANAPAPTEADLVAYCRDRMASFKKPKRVLFVGELPKNAYGKVLRRQARDDLAAQL
jgi:long-chain acyl-CoA synthetase